MDVDLDALRARYIGDVFDESEFTVGVRQIIDFAETCGERLPCYTDPDDPDFQAPPTYPSALLPGRMMPEGFPRIGGIGMDGGKAVEAFRPLRPDVPVTGRTHIHDIYTKTGRSGEMVFIVVRTEFFDAAGELLARADTRVVHREHPQ